MYGISLITAGIVLALPVAVSAETPDHVSASRIKNLIVEFTGKKTGDLIADSKDAKFKKHVAEDLKEVTKKLKWEKSVTVSTWFTAINGAAIQISQGSDREYKTLIGKVRALPYVRKADFDGPVR